MEAIFSIHSSIVPADICQQNMVLFQPGSSDSPLATPDSPLLALVHLDIPQPRSVASRARLEESGAVCEGTMIFYL